MTWNGAFRAFDRSIRLLRAKLAGTDRLLPCPVCRCHRFHVDTLRSARIYISCELCGLSVFEDSFYKAVIAWNRNDGWRS